MINRNNQKKYSIASAPYRISLGGGGTDLPFYASKREGLLVSGAINEYITVLVARRTLDNDIFIQYSKTEKVKKIDDIKHSIIREALRYFKIHDSFQLSTFSTMPTFTGLGSSSTLIVAIVKAIHNLNNSKRNPTQIAEEAFYIEREVLGLAGGFQDQYISSLGGIQIISVSKNLLVKTKPLKLESKVLSKLQNCLFLIHSGIERKSEIIIKDQQKEHNIHEAYDKIKSIGEQSIEYMKKGQISALGNAMHEHWKVKKAMTRSMSNSQIDKMYLTLRSLGSIGGKIIGAGGGGFFLMVVTENKKEFKKKAIEKGFKFVDFDFEFSGVHSVEIQDKTEVRRI
jgi:D-glycero-alpha-D-manno-heptose-7-phosphate kinase